MSESDKFNPKRDKVKHFICPYFKNRQGFERIMCGIHANIQQMADNSWRCEMCKKAGGPRVNRTFGMQSTRPSGNNKGLDNTPNYYKAALRQRIGWTPPRPIDLVQRFMPPKVVAELQADYGDKLDEKLRKNKNGVVV